MITPQQRIAIFVAASCIVRNLPLQAGKFYPCERGCGKPARGGGVCLQCAKRDLAKVVGWKLAHRYVASCKETRAIMLAMNKVNQS